MISVTNRNNTVKTRKGCGKSIVDVVINYINTLQKIYVKNCYQREQRNRCNKQSRR